MNKTTGALRRFLALALLTIAPVAYGLTCDVNGDGVIDLTDINLITAARNQPASGPNDPRDADGDGTITVSDVRICSQRCTRTACSTANLPPTANAGPDQTTALNATVILNGAGSSDPEGGALTYQWSFTQRPPGSAAALNVADPVHPTFVVDVSGTYIVQLIVRDPLNASSTPDTVQLSTSNSRPIANAGPDQTVLVTQSVTLDGHLSSDADGDPLTYSWAFTQKPSGSAATLNLADPVHPTFVVDKPGNYTARLVVNDGFVNSLPDDVVITTQNSPPIARAGPNQTHFVGETAVLDGSGSSDVDGDPLTYIWSITQKPSGSLATLSNSSVVNPSFVVDKAGTYVVQLIVNDGHVNSAPSTVSISTINSAPVANAGPDQAGNIGQLVQLNGAGSSDVDGDPLSFAWSFTQRPSGSAAALSSTTIVNPTFSIDVAGTYVAQLIVNDGLVNSAPDTVQISTNNQPPVANAGTAQTVPLGSTVQLDGSLSSDPEHQPLTYAWSFQSKPQGSIATLSSTTAATPTFVADKAGQYVLQLIVSDGSLNSAPSTVTISTANSRPVANAGPPQTVNAGATVQLNGSGSFDPDGPLVVLSYQWSFTTFPGATAPTLLPNASVVSPTFVATLPGTYVAQLIVSDGLLSSNPSTVMITTSNTPPVANDDSYATAQDTPLVVGAPGVLVNDTDAQNDPLTAILVGNVTHGVLTLNANGGFTYTPTAGYNGPDSFTYRANDGTSNSNVATVSITVSAPTAADIRVLKSVSNATPNVGDTVTFTVQAANLGPASATGVVVTDLLPAGYTYVSSNASIGSYASGTGVWTIGALALNQNAALTVTATVLGTGPYLNTATRTASTPSDPNGANDAATATTTPVSTADIRILKSVDNATPNVGATVTFTVQAGNLGPAAATGVVVTDLLPAGYTLVSSNATIGAYSSGTGVWNIGSLAFNQSAVLTVTATVLGTGPYLNTATRTASTPNDTNNANDSATATTAPVAMADIVITKSVNNATPNVGANVVFTVQATNQGPAVASGVVVTDLLPAGYTYVSSTQSIGTPYNNTTGVWNIGSLGLFQGATLQVTATVLGTGPYVNTATKTASIPTDPTPANDSASATTNPVSSADIVVTKSVNNATPNVGSSVVFTVQATNQGPAVASGVQITDLLPAGYTFVSATQSSGAYNNTTGVWNIGSLGLFQGATLQVTATVLGTGPYLNTATKTASTPNDPNTANDSASATTAPVSTADIRLTKVVDNATPNVGGQVTFTVTASNLGPALASSIVVQDLLPAGYTFVSKSLSGATSAYNESTGAWTIPALSVNQSALLQVTATVLGTGPYLNTATRTASTPSDPNNANDSASATTTPAAGADIALSMTIDNPTPTIGQQVQFIVRALNNGPGAAAGVVVQDLLPSGYTYVSQTAFNGTYNQTTGVWTVGALSLNQTAALAINATVNATGVYNNTATRTASTPADPNPGNDTVTLVVTPFVGADIAVSMTIDNPTPTIGQQVQFIVRALNNGPGAAAGVVVQDLLPSGYTYVSQTAFNGTYNQTTGVWTVGALSLNQTAALAINATVNATGVYNNTATRTASTPADPNPGNDTVTLVVTPFVGADIAVSMTIDNPTPTIGQQVQFIVRALNNGPGAAAGVVVQDLLPSGYTYVSQTAFNGTYNQTTGVWTVGALSLNQTAALAINATVNATGVYNNTATRTASTPADPNPGNDTVTLVVTPFVGADIAVSMTIDNPTPTIGQQVQFIVRALNNGPGAAAGVVVQDLLPSGYTYVSQTAFNGTYNQTTGVWTVGALSLNQTAALAINATVNATGVYNNTATRTASTPADPNPGNDTVTLVVTPFVGADIAVSMTIDNPTPTIGQQVQFIVRALNNGPGAAAGVVVQDLLPSGYTYVSQTAFNGTYNQTTGVWTVGALSLNQTAALAINATVNATGVYNNSATRTASSPSDPNAGNDTATLVVNPFTTADIAMSMTIDNAAPTIGQQVQFIVRALNNGPGAAAGWWCRTCYRRAIPTCRRRRSTAPTIRPRRVDGGRSVAQPDCGAGDQCDVERDGRL